MTKEDNNENFALSDEDGKVNNETTRLNDEAMTLNDEATTLNDEATTLNDEAGQVGNEATKLQGQSAKLVETEQLRGQFTKPNAGTTSADSQSSSDTESPRGGGKRPGRSSIRVLWSWVWPIAIGVAAAKILATWVIGFAYVPSASMVPAIENPGRILLDHVATETAPIHEGEVVVFHWPDDPSQIFVKRVIGLPGDTILVKNGHVYRNGKVLNEPYLHGLVTEGTYGPYQVPADHYFMMGDNRNISDDSRKWVHKYVPRSYIIARADYQVWPLSEFHRIEQ